MIKEEKEDECVGIPIKYGEIFVRPLPLEEKVSNLIIFNKSPFYTTEKLYNVGDNQIMLGKVFAIAHQLADKNEPIHRLGLKVGDIVLYQGFHIVMKIRGEEAVILKGSNVLGLIN